MPVTASEQQNFSVLSQVIDGNVDVSRKWFSLQDNKLDGTYFPIDSTGASSIGWWGTSLSDASGAFAVPPTLEVAEAISIAIVRVAGDALLDEYPVDFDIDLYAADASLLRHDEIRGNTEVNWKGYYNQYFDIARLVVTVHKVNKPSRTVKIMEAYETSETLTVYDVDSAIVAAIDGIVPTNIQNSDTVLIGHDIESFDVIAELWTSDSFSIAGEEAQDLTNIHTVMQQPERRVHGKVEIMYSDPFKLQQLVVTADSTLEGTFLSQTADNIGRPKAKWFTLHDNKLDGTYSPMDSSGSAQVGWWANVLSDAQGMVNPAPTLTATMLPRTIDSLKVTGDRVADIFPEDFTITLYNEQDILLHSRTITGNTEGRWIEYITPVDNVAKMTLTVTKVNKPYSTVRVLEFVTSVIGTYTDEDGLVMMHLLEERDISDGSLPIGNITANEIDVRLDNTDKRFTTGNEQSSVSTLLKPNRRIQAWLGAEVVPGTIEWYSIGTFWSTQWRAEENDIYAQVTGRDIIHRLSQTDYAKGTVQTSISLKQLAEAVLLDAGLEASEFYIDPVLDTHVIPNAWIDRMPHRDALRLIAEAGLAVAYVDRDGIVTLTKGTIPKHYMVQLSKEADVFNLQNPQNWSSVVNYVEAEWLPLELDSDQQVHNSTGLGETIAPGETIELTLEFTAKPVKTVSGVTITAGPNITITSAQHFAWGSVIAATNGGATDEVLDAVGITGQPMKTVTFVQTAKDDVLIRDYGKLPYRYSNTLIQTRSLATTIAQTLLNNFKDPQREFIVTTRGNIALKLGDRIRLPIYGGTQDTTLVRQQLTYDGALESVIDALKIQ